MNEKFRFIKRFFKEDLLPFSCPFCKRDSLILLPETWLEHDKSELYHSQDWFDACDHVELIYTALYRCSNMGCQQKIVSSGIGGIDINYIQENDVEYQPEYYSYFQPKIFIPPLSFFSIPEETPDEIKILLEFSFSIVLQSASSAVNSLRSSIEELLDIYIPETSEKKLHHRIEQDVPKHPTLSPYKDYLMAIKWLGNSGSHALDQITLQDIKDVYEIMELVLNGLYGNTKNTLQKALLINQMKRPLTRQERKNLSHK